MRARQAALVVMAAVLLAVGSFALGRATADDVRWLTGTATLGGDDASPQFTARADTGEEWAYGARGSVSRWVDARGESHAGGWPECLMPPTEQHPTRPREVPVRFATVSVDDGSFGSGPEVVAVDCRL